MMRRKSLGILHFLLILLALWLAGLYWFTRTMPEALTEKTTVADAIVVLTGGNNRLEAGFDLLEQERGKKLFISGVYQGVEVRELLDHWKKEDRKDIDCCVVLGFEADDTIGNARESAAWMEKEGYKSLFLVTANYHLKRALLLFRHYAPELVITPHPVSPAGLDMQNWWRDPQNRMLVIKEYMKYVASLVVVLLPKDMP